MTGARQARRSPEREKRFGLVAAAAALGGLGVTAGVERVAAGAAGHGVRVVHREAATHKRVHVVDLRALEIHGAKIVDQQAYAVSFDELVPVLGGLLDGHPVLKSRATTRCHKYAQRTVRRALLGEKSLQLLGGLRGNADHARFLRARASCLPYPESSFLIATMQVYETSPSSQATLELKRKLPKQCSRTIGARAPGRRTPESRDFRRCRRSDARPLWRRRRSILAALAVVPRPRQLPRDQRPRSRSHLRRAATGCRSSQPKEHTGRDSSYLR